MPALWTVEAIDVFKQGCFRLLPGLPQAVPNQLSLKSFEEGFHVGVRVRLLTAAWDEGFAALKQFRERESHYRLPQTDEEGDYRLGHRFSNW